MPEVQFVEKEAYRLAPLWFSRLFWQSRPILWMLFAINVAGTIYGYIWYGDQLAFTYRHLPHWYIPFVPDSPTSSLFFTLSLALLLFDRKGRASQSSVGGLVAAFGAVTSFKYGVWAVTMIFVGGYQGDVLEWQDWMLVVSQLGMAVEALVYVGYFRIRPWAYVAVAGWILANDYMDYVKGVYPWLPEQLLDDLDAIGAFTLALSGMSLAIVAFVYRRSKTGQPPI